MPALVLGATGFVGRELVAQLCRGGAAGAIAHVRPDSKSLADWRAKLAALGAEVDTTAWDAAALGAMMAARGVEVVYIVIGTTRGKARADGVGGDIYEAVDYGLTKLAVDAAVASGRAPRLVYLSSLGAKIGARSAYLAARGKAEAYVQASGLPWMIARPAIITGARDDTRVGERGAAVVGDGLLAVVGALGGGALRAKYKSTTPAVLAAALIRLAHAEPANQIVDGRGLR